MNVYVQDELLAADPTAGQKWADILTGLVHGAELSSLTVYIATLDQVTQTCGSGALGCYANNRLIAIGQDYHGLSARAVVTHEYGHHVANNRDNAPWQAVDWGTKRWATYVGVCRRTKSGELAPGDESSRYTFNPGEALAEDYRLLNERRLGLPESPWAVVDDSFYPDQTALDLLALDVTSPWTGNTSSELRRVRDDSVIRPRVHGGDTARRELLRDPDLAAGRSAHAPARRSGDAPGARLLDRHGEGEVGCSRGVRPADAAGAGQAGEGRRRLHARGLQALAAVPFPGRAPWPSG